MHEVAIGHTGKIMKVYYHDYMTVYIWYIDHVDSGLHEPGKFTHFHQCSTLYMYID